MAFTEDLDQFFSPDDFATAAVITLANDDTVELNVIFDNPTEGVLMMESAVEADAPFFECQTSDLEGVPRDKTNTVEINSVTYKIQKIRDGGTGISTVYLKT